MNEINEILAAAEQGDPQASARLLPLVYDELRRVATQALAQEQPGLTLQPTALVHEAYLRLVGTDAALEPRWDNRRHFFAACAEAMRRILVERARRKAAIKHGGTAEQIPLDETLALVESTTGDLLDLDEALGELERHDESAARLVKLRYFAGLSHQEAADALGITRRAADRLWALARAWLRNRLREA